MKVSCYVVVTKGKGNTPARAHVPFVYLTPHQARELYNPTIFGSYSDKKTARDIAKVIGGRVCELKEIDV
jgi:hypothetical protein